MTTATTVPHARAHRRRRLIGLICAASEELAALERAEARHQQTTVTVAATLPPEYVDGTPLSTAPGHVIRAWAHTNGIPTGQRGAIPKALRQAYTAAHPNEDT